MLHRIGTHAGHGSRRQDPLGWTHTALTEMGGSAGVYVSLLDPIRSFPVGCLYISFFRGFLLLAKMVLFEAVYAVSVDRPGFNGH